jgi:hypothetical protein
MEKSVDLDTIAQLHPLLAREPSLRAEEKELFEIERSLREGLVPGPHSEAPPSGSGPLVEFLDRNPKIYELLVADLAHALLQSVKEVNAHYAPIFAERAPTEDEKNLGKELKGHLLAALELLKTVGWRPTNERGTTPT